MFSVVLGAAVAFLVTVLLGSKFIEFLQSRKFGQFVREEGPQTHLIKAGTPTMGGIVMLTGLVGALVVVARPNVATLTTLLLVAVVAGIGLYDDAEKAAEALRGNLHGGDYLVVKGSRGVGLDTLTRKLRESLALV